MYQNLTYSHIRFSDNSGGSIEDAIFIMNATGEMDGVGSEYYYLEKKFGKKGVDWDLKMQSTVGKDGHNYDKMDIQLASGEKTTVYFDISDFFGELLEGLGL